MGGGEVHLDEEAVRGFLRGRYPLLVSGLTVVSGSRQAAGDAVQEALARAWERSERGHRVESLDAWVTTVAVNLLRSGSPPHIYVMNADGSRVVQLTDDAEADFEPSWSPDGSAILFATDRNRVVGQVYVMDADGSHARLLLRVPDNRAPLSGARVAAFAGQHDLTAGRRVRAS